MGAGCYAGDLHFPDRQIDKEEDEEALQSSSRPDLYGEEICYYDQLPMLCQKRLPCRFPTELENLVQAGRIDRDGVLRRLQDIRQQTMWLGFANAQKLAKDMALHLAPDTDALRNTEVETLVNAERFIELEKILNRARVREQE